MVFCLYGLLFFSRPNKPSLLPPLYEGEALACRVLDVNPSGARFLQPVYLELPHFSALRDGERELVVLRTQDGGWNWQEVCVEDMKGILENLLLIFSNSRVVSGFRMVVIGLNQTS